MSLPHIPGLRPGDTALRAIPFSKPPPKDQKKELRSFYREAEHVLEKAKAGEIALRTTKPEALTSERTNTRKDNASYRSEKEMNLADFRELMSLFKTASVNGDGKLKLPEFKQAFASVLGDGLTDNQMGLLFCQVDANMDEAVDWDEFSTFMLLRAEGQSQMREQAETQLFNDQHPRMLFNSPHKDVVIRIRWLEKVSKYLTCGRDGIVCFWSDRWKIQRSISTVGWVGRDFFFPSVSHHASGDFSKRQSPWIHDCVFLANTNKLAMSSDDHAITFYDLTSMEAQLRLDLHDTVALSLSVYFDAADPDSDSTMLLYGTDSGQCCVLSFSNSVFFPPNPPPTTETPTMLIDAACKLPGTTLWKRKAHRDWTLQIEYLNDLKTIVSCSSNPRESIVTAMQTGTKKWRVSAAAVRKGVNTFAYSKFPLALVTGGTDRLLRIWNPHRLNRPTASFGGHLSPIMSITVNPFSGQVISLSFDRTIKIWDIRKQSCLQSIVPEFKEARPDMTLTSIFFDTFNGGKLIAASNVVVVYGLVDKVQQRGNVRSHEAPVSTALWNPVFGQVVSGCDASVVNVWDATTGQKTFRFAHLHGKAEITAMTFDNACRRLITGGRDGSIKVWNFNNGQLIQELMKGDNAEVTSILYIEIKSTPYMVATGWNRLIQLFPADSESLKVQPTVTMPSAHKDDVLTMAFSPPDLLATGSYDGEIIFVNVGGAGTIVGRVKVDDPDDRRVSVDKILFLHRRAQDPDSRANLISSGSDGIVRWWNTHETLLVHEQDATLGRHEGVFSMCLNSQNTVLVTGDAGGYISVWDVKDTCMAKRHKRMALVKVFRAHLRSVTSLDMTDGGSLVSASTDRTVRMWTLAGGYIGTFGQIAAWDVSNPSTF
ncbi:WD40-repeat-containing domain protein, partial [Fimicolochytrium jonesii]|uniref:WD40-repeat-containing domain protein n=1 Tax=Fimicolochytrium jonesii TaxID=1396493 RepID=UPI0022FDB64B